MQFNVPLLQQRRHLANFSTEREPKREGTCINCCDAADVKAANLANRTFGSSRDDSSITVAEASQRSHASAAPRLKIKRSSAGKLMPLSSRTVWNNGPYVTDMPSVPLSVKERCVHVQLCMYSTCRPIIEL